MPRMPRKVVTIAATLFVLAVLASVLVPAGRVLEEQPAFCASCHVMETSYDNWLSTGAAQDHPTCIECHSGSGVIGTVQAQLQGIHELAAQLTGWYTTPLKAQVPNGYCTKCHDNAARLEREHDEVRQFASQSCGACHNHQMGRAFNPEHRGRRAPFAGTITELNVLLGTFVKLDVNGDRRADYVVRLGTHTVLKDAQGNPVKVEQLRVGDRLTVTQFDLSGEYYEARQAVVSRRSS